MGIPESQLEIWSQQGAVATAEATYRSIRQALTSNTSPIRGKDFEVYLHGSYKNSTNIRGDSDVDVVVQLNSTFRTDLSGLPESEKAFQRPSYLRAAYQWDDFRADVLHALQDYYGSSKVWETTRSLRIAGGPRRLPSDVVTCLQYRKYERFRSMSDQRFTEGIIFYALKENRWLINFPKLQYQNGVSKNSQPRTDGRYKPTVRVFKNARTYLVDHGVIAEDLAPSHLLEALLYNVPDECFATTYQETFQDVIRWLMQSFGNGRYKSFLRQHEQLALFGDAPDQWGRDRAVALLLSLVELWKGW